MTGAEIRRMLPLQTGALLGPMAGTGMVTLIPALSGVYGVPVGTVGLAITAYMVPFAVAQLFSGSISQVLTGRRTAMLGFVGFTLGSVACALAPTLAGFLAFRFVQGLGAAFLFPILMALVGEVVAPERLGRAIGAFGVTQTLGLTLGPLIAGLLEVSVGWRWFFVALGVFAALNGVAFARLFTEEPRAEGAQGSVWGITLAVLRQPTVWLLSLAAAGLFFAMIGPYTYLAAWLKAVPGLGEDRIGLVLAVAGVVGIPASAVAGRWVDRVGRKPVGLAGLLCYIGVLLAFATAPYSFAEIMLLSGALGFAGAVAWTALNTLAVEVAPTLRKPVASIYNSFRFLGYALAPPVLGLVYGRDNATAVYLVSALVVAGSAGCLAALRLGRSPGF
ncbi:MAG TPA: MFS transporter [Methylomirabilota bacterium]|nr:MFS transporter [Methylomirabilota bacterium]